MSGFSEYFSDEELAEAKDRFPKKNRIHALIRRLEAAESGFTEYHGTEMSKGCSCRCCKAWLLLKGGAGK